MRQTRWLTAAIAAAALLAAACGGTKAAPSAATTASTSTIAAAPTSTAAAQSSGASGVASTSSNTAQPVTFVAEVWVDNWFALSVNGAKVGEDSVPITTERSSNAETITFQATYPLTIAFTTKDYKENDTGLEYIGTSRQQMGDGGAIAQIKEKASGKLVAATGADWRGLVIHRAPLNTECEKSKDPTATCRSEILPEPAGWTQPGFDDSTWTPATIYTASQVGTKDGYDDIKWASSAKLIWSSELHVDNTILWRYTAKAPA